MRSAAALLAVVALALPAAQAGGASSREPVLGLVYTPGYGKSILARFDPVTLERAPGAAVRLGGNAHSWSFSPDGRLLAVAAAPLSLRVVDVSAMQAIGDIRLAARGGVVNAVTWVRPDRLLAIVNTPEGALVAAVDPTARRVIHRTQLRRPFAFAIGRLSDGLAFLLDSTGRFAPARIAVVDADGGVRLATVGGVSVGTVSKRKSGGEALVRRRGAALAVDPAGRRAYLVAPDYRVAEIDLRTLAVSYHGPVRKLAKSIEGSFRFARWLGNGLIALSGADYTSTNGRSTEATIGVRMIDVRGWSTRVLDEQAEGFAVAPGLVITEKTESGGNDLHAVAYGLDGRERYRLDLIESTWLTVAGTLGYACKDVVLRKVIELSNGAVLREVDVLAATMVRRGSTVRVRQRALRIRR